MTKPKNQNRTFHLLQKADILTCYEHGAFQMLIASRLTVNINRHGPAEFY